MIDIFNHFMPRTVFDARARAGARHPAMKAFPELPTLWDVDERLRMMDEFDGLQQVLSLANPPLEQLGGARADAAGRAHRERRPRRAVRAAIRERFPGFIASMPANNVEACLEETDRSMSTSARAASSSSPTCSASPSRCPEFRPIFRRMAEHDLPVWIHPIRGPNSADYATEKASENEIWFTFGWPYETTACVTRLIFSGLYDELPGLKIITHHYCGMVPFYAGKIQLGFDQIFFGTSQQNPQAEKAGLRRAPMDYYRMIYADTALNGAVAATRCGHAFFGTEHSVFATDAPFDAEDGRLLIRSTLAAIDALEIPRAEKDLILGGNASRF